MGTQTQGLGKRMRKRKLRRLNVNGKGNARAQRVSVNGNFNARSTPLIMKNGTRTLPANELKIYLNFMRLRRAGVLSPRQRHTPTLPLLDPLFRAL